MRRLHLRNGPRPLPKRSGNCSGTSHRTRQGTTTLNEYYQRYAVYHTDASLLELRRRKPLIAIWDDHEIADNAWADGALGHQSNEGNYAERVASARKAYYDWMPIRGGPNTAAYRSFDWGDLARIIVLDTRLAGRSQPYRYSAAQVRALTQGGDAAAAALAEIRAALSNPARSMLGAVQEDWLSRTLARSKARAQPWQILLQQVVMGAQTAAPDLLALAPEGASAGARRYFAMGVALGAAGVAWNPDSWSGSGAARGRLLGACVTHANNAVVLSGDSHNCWLNNLRTAPGQFAAIEFAGGSVTSPGFERPLPLGAPGAREAMMRAANSDLVWCDVTHRGYGALTFTRTHCSGEWRAFNSVSTPQAPRRSPRFSIAKPVLAAAPEAGRSEPCAEARHSSSLLPCKIGGEERSSIKFTRAPSATAMETASAI
ncbi:MAG: alkaline phosphatase D family protein [Hyphomonadaceae bacterium]|nr:alkaline phosphatase D family protein [Hyphomonadaceae bacterium]